MNPAQTAEHAARRTLRTPNDVAALCVELLRAVREQEWNARRRGGPASSVDRAWRAWRADLDRYGPLHLVSEAGRLRAGEGGPPVGRGHLDDLANRLKERGVASIRFEPGLDAPTYAAFVSLLAAEPGEIEGHGGAAGFLPERGVGIRLVGPDEEAAPDEEKADDPSEDDLGLEPDDGDVPQLEPLGPSRDPDPSGETTVRLERAGDTTLPLGRTAAGDTTVRMTPAEARAHGETAATPERPDALAESPEADVPPPPGSALAALLDRHDATPYATRVARAVAEAAAWHAAGDADACHRTVVALADHSGAKGGLGRPERSAALGGLRELCTGRVLADLIGRTTSHDGAANLRASRVLLKLGEPVVGELIAAIDGETDPGRREELLGIAVAMGRATTPTLHRAMEGRSPGRARIAARIAGEIQEERAVPTLSKLLDHKRAEVRGESARALARIGNVAALTTLKRGLTSQHEDVSSLCAYCLGVTGSPDAAEALTETLRDARRARRTQLASAVIRSLGRLGREESVPELKRVIDKRSFFRRQEIRELKLQAIGALAKLPGQRARDVLEAVAQGSDMGLAVAARRAMKEQSEASA
ncbi:MAG TPA: HEAT repeat domain-containing protein [Myxococcota bacterium]|nr:HEAT repeat domain-containing protein [Myxococcota bacterium]